jgi:hypothetical protein
MNIPMTGGCACGAIRYTCTAAPVFRLNCHCRDCQHQSGAPFISGFIMATDALVIEGEPRWFETKADSGHTARRGFCPTCGTQLFSESTISGGRGRGVRSASLDDQSWFAPQADIFTKSAQPWVQLDPTLPKFEKGPTPR